MTHNLNKKVKQKNSKNKKKAKINKSIHDNYFFIRHFIILAIDKLFF